ncbi:unnamed protein product [Gongylonema pulchrum]|uniref:Peptidase M14 domain-containing protein n=1 Tax=Gongylonema pulchrum TaxID=637853 RepID=A0A3P7P5F0_9BILA|nr:unnamed protein product [Gongylonema pulchrum]
MSDLYINDDEMTDFWKPPIAVNESVDIMVYPGYQNKLGNLFKKHAIKFYVAVDDVAQYLRNSNEAALSRRKLLDGQKRFRDDSSNIAELHMGEYHSYDDIVRWLKSLERRYSDIVKVTSIGVTPEKRTIYGVRDFVDFKTISIVARQAAREFDTGRVD